jgi:hypothetical protein
MARGDLSLTGVDFVAPGLPPGVATDFRAPMVLRARLHAAADTHR